MPISSVAAAEFPVIPDTEVCTELPAVLRHFRKFGALTTPAVFGTQRRTEGVMIPVELYEELPPVIEDLEIAHIVRDRATAGASVPLADIAAPAGLDPGDYR